MIRAMGSKLTIGYGKNWYEVKHDLLDRNWDAMTHTSYD